MQLHGRFVVITVPGVGSGSGSGSGSGVVVVTTAVWALSAVADATEFVAVTRTRIVAPTSSAASA